MRFRHDRLRQPKASAALPNAGKAADRPAASAPAPRAADKPTASPRPVAARAATGARSAPAAPTPADRRASAAEVWQRVARSKGWTFREARS